MEPVTHKMKIFLGEYEVVEAKFMGGVTISLNKQVHITLWLGDLVHGVKPGDKLPLYTEITCLNSTPTNPTNSPNAS